MDNIAIAYKDQLIQVLTFLTVPFLAFVVSLGMVYLFGRMLNILKTDIAKNATAFISMMAVYIYYFFKYDTRYELTERIWYMIIYTSVSVIFYVLIGFKLYPLIESKFDRLSKPKNKKGK